MQIRAVSIGKFKMTTMCTAHYALTGNNEQSTMRRKTCGFYMQQLLVLAIHSIITQ